MNGREVSASSRAAAVTGGRVAVVVAVTLVLAACSGDDDASPSTTLAPPPTSLETPPTTVASTAPETSESTPSTEPVPVTTPPTLPPEPTTTATPSPPGEDQVKQDVIDAAYNAWKSLNDLRLDPTNDRLLEALASTRTGAALDSAIEIITNYRARGQRSITHPEFPAFFEAYPATAEVDLDLGIASVEYCRLGSNIFVEVGANADGTDLVLDDTINIYRERSDLLLTDVGWLEKGGAILQKSPGVTVCAN